MTLTTRLSLFFLTMLGFVLTGFSVTLYFLARENFYHESEEHLDGALSALIAAADIERDGVLWLPDQRDLSHTATLDTWGQLIWIVRDDQGRMVGHSSQSSVAEFPIAKPHESTSTNRDGESLKWQGANWLVRQFEVRPEVDSVANNDSELADVPSQAQKYPALFITAAISLQPVENTLLRLATALVATSGAIWLAALFLGRALCRRALRPLAYMATAAGEINAAALERRLPLSSTQDELYVLGKSFNNLLDRLHESFERQRRFTSDASHQLRTPLAAILGQAEVALRRDRSPEEYRRVLGSVHQDAGHLRHIIESLLYLARADHESLLPNMVPVDLGAFLNEHLVTWRQHPRFKDIVLEPNDAGECRVEIHPILAGELINLLLDNACKYSEPGTPVRLQIEREATVVRLLVQDQGKGIDERDLPNVFAPFFRAPQPRDRAVEGVGLGLSIAQRLAGAFGGTLTVSSRAGEGSCFIWTLPAAFHTPGETNAAPNIVSA